MENKYVVFAKNPNPKMIRKAVSEMRKIFGEYAKNLYLRDGDKKIAHNILRNFSLR
jgi:hypothetical protein